MRRRLPIRVRLAATSVVLVVAVLALTGAAVVALERQSLDDSLAEQARLEARSLLAVASQAEPDPVPVDDGTHEGDGDDDEGVVPAIPDEADGDGDLTQGESSDDDSATVALDASTEPYLVRRGASDNLLAVRAPGVPAVLNADDARGLLGFMDDPVGSEIAQIDGNGYTIAIARDRLGITAVAGVPREQADERIGEVVRALLIAGGIGALLTVIGAWFAARSALRPLTTMTRRAEAVTAGRLDARVGPLGGDDEIARLTRALDEMLERLEQAFAAQQRFVQDASHELRTPITIARGHLEVTDPRREEPAAVQAEIDLAVAELARMGHLVERLLLLARAGVLPAERLQRCSANALAEDALARVRGNAARRWVLATDSADPQVLADHDALVDVLVNLLRNAERHTDDGGLIRAVVRGTSERVELSIEDDGEGIAADLLPTIFDRFTRADAARTRDAGGAGLGLAISRAYTEAHGGTIRVASQPGRGATFTVSLPRAR